MPKAQKMIFSATVPTYIQQIAKNYMKSPIMIDLVGDENTQIPPTITNELYFVEDKEDDRRELIKRMIEVNEGKKILVFLDTKRAVQQFEGRNIITLHGDIPQASRNVALNKFKSISDAVMVATDVAARGLDVDDIDIVIQGTYQKKNIDSMVHRAGRTGRAGKTGTNIMFATPEDS